MCYHTKLTKDAQEVKNRFKREIKNIDLFTQSQDFNGFGKPLTPIITIADPSVISVCQWGFMPPWGKAPILNIREEEMTEKKTFSDILENRCVIIVDGFYEWKNLDEKGKKKQKYEIGFGGELFCLAGLYKVVDGKPEYAICTTLAMGEMNEIHNRNLIDPTKDNRMPFALNSEDKISAWIHNEPVQPDWDFTAVAV